jgi:hypothetical protein
MECGTVVRVMAYGGEQLVRRVVAERITRIMVCNEAEYQAAIREGREPDGIGFLKENDIEDSKRGRTRHSAA